MRAGEKSRLGALRLISAAIKQFEVDQRNSVTDADTIAILDKMAKQRRDSIEQFQKAERHDLVGKEQFELAIIQTYLPQALSEAELNKLIDESISATDSQTPKDMGKVMAHLRQQVQGRAEMGRVSAIVKSKLVS